MKKKLTIETLIKEAQIFCAEQSKFQHKELFGVTDGKAVGTLIEQKFQKHLNDKYEVTIGSSASGVDLPSEDPKSKTATLNFCKLFICCKRKNG
jgi:hypothetical protein